MIGCPNKEMERVMNAMTFETDESGMEKEIECEDCEGSGIITCPECDGSGMDDDGDQCDMCMGDGDVECEECS